MNTCDQLPVEFNKEQTSVPLTSVEFPKAMGSLSHTHSWYKYVCLYICIYEIAEKPTQTESVSVQKKTNKCGHNHVGVTHRVSDHHLHDRLQSLAAITLHQLWMMGVDKTIINCSILDLRPEYFSRIQKVVGRHKSSCWQPLERQLIKKVNYKLTQAATSLWV
jgi:hypothetical protein